MKLAPINKKLITNATAATISAAELTEDFKDLHLTVSATTAAASGATVRVYGSFNEQKPDFTVAASLTNKYFTVSVKDLNNVASIDGSTGIVLGASLTDSIKAYMVNTNALRWICIKVESVSGTVDVSVDLDASDNI